MQALADQLIQQRYAVDIATQGEDAKSYLSLFSYDLIVLDLMLPDGNGIEFCKTFRQAGYENPLLILTAHASTVEKVNALDAGADDYVVKPFDFAELGARIRALLRREHQTLPTVLHWGPLTLDPNTCETYYHATPIHFTPKEFALTELFLRNPNRVFSLGAIIEDLWSFEDPPSEDAVRTHIKGLRQKLKVAGAPKDLIKTVYGLGYRLKPTADLPVEHPASPSVAPPRDPVPVTDQNDAIPLAVTRAWKQYQDTMQSRIDSLETAAVALSQGVLSQELHQNSRSNAHKLVGALGSFGFSEGSRLARELEQLLQRSASLDSEETWRVLALVQQLRQSLTQSVPQNVPDTVVNTLNQGAPLLLIVSHDRQLCRDLKATAQLYRFQTQIVHELNQVSATVARVHPQLVLFDSLLLKGKTEQLCDLIQPVEGHLMALLILEAHPTLEKRLAMIQQGADQILERSSSPEQLIKAAAKMLQTMTAQARVGIVDDDPQFLAILKASLAPWGFQLLTLEGASRLWETLEQQPLDVLVLDIEMPGINGLELCQILRADPRWQQLPILFLTAHQDDQTRTQAFRAGADDFINKSVAPTELATRILNRLKHQNLPTSL